MPSKLYFSSSDYLASPRVRVMMMLRWVKASGAAVWSWVRACVSWISPLTICSSTWVRGTTQLCSTREGMFGSSELREHSCPSPQLSSCCNFSDCYQSPVQVTWRTVRPNKQTKNISELGAGKVFCRGIQGIGWLMFPPKPELPKVSQHSIFKSQVRKQGCRACDQLMPNFLIGWWWGNRTVSQVLVNILNL